MIRQLFFFTVVGAIGFVVDASVLYAGLAVGLGYYIGRVISYICAATVTWFLNRRWTFSTAAGDNKKSEWLRFLMLNLGGFIVNYGTYVLALHALQPADLPVKLIPLLAVGCGSAAGLLVNFTINKYLVFRPSAAE